MQWLKSAMVVSSVVFVAAFAAEGCSNNNPGTGDGGDSGPITGKDSGKLDSSKPDTGTTTCPTSDPACESCDVSEFTPSAQGKPIAGANQCDATDIGTFVTACLSGTTGSQTACTAWQNAEQASDAGTSCLSCTFTQDTAANWGLLYCGSSGSCSINVPGCLDLALNQVSQENSTATGSCGDYLSASYGCQDAACSTCTTTTDEDTCTNDAVAAECLTYANAFQNASVCSSLNGDTVPPNVNECFPAAQTGFTDAELTKLTNIFCGAGF